MVIASLYFAFSFARAVKDILTAAIATTIVKNAKQIDNIVKYVFLIIFAICVSLPPFKKKELSEGAKKFTSSSGTALNITLSAHGKSAVPVTDLNTYPINFSTKDAIPKTNCPNASDIFDSLIWLSVLGSSVADIPPVALLYV